MSEKAINDLYIKTYGRPASATELNFHSNVYGSSLDDTESKDLYNRMVSAPGYTPLTAGEGVDTGVSTDPVTPPNTSSPATSSPEVASTPTYTTEEKPLGMGETETVYRDPSGNIITREEALQLQATSDTQAEADAPFVVDESSQGYKNYADILNRSPESQEASDRAGELTREEFFAAATPELRKSDPTFARFNQVLARDPGLGGLDYYRNVRPDLMQDPRAFRQAAIESGEFGSRARDLYRENMGYDPTQSSLQGLIQSGTYLNPNEFRGAIARQNLASRSRYTQPEAYAFQPYAPEPQRYNPYATQRQPQQRFAQRQPQQRSLMSEFTQPRTSSFSQPIYQNSFAPQSRSPSQYYSQPFFNQYQPQQYAPQARQQQYAPQSRQPSFQMRPPSSIGGKGGQSFNSMQSANQMSPVARSSPFQGMGAGMGAGMGGIGGKGRR